MNRNSEEYFSDISETNTDIVIGYYNLKGKAQVCRLICEYLSVPYRDQLFTLTEWDKFKNTKTKTWPYPELPFLKEGDFILTDSVTMCVYVIHRFGSSEMLGRDLADQAIVQTYLRTIQIMSNVITLNCQPKTPEQLIQFKDLQWQKHVLPRLIKYEQAAKENNWFVGYLTVIDFSIYELANYMDHIFPNKLEQFPKLTNIQRKIGQLQAIKQYEQSERCIKQWCPSKLLEELKIKQIDRKSDKNANCSTPIQNRTK